MEDTELFKDFPRNTTFSGFIDGLNGYTDYEFRMLAYTKVGGKLKGSPLTRKTKEGGKAIALTISTKSFFEINGFISISLIKKVEFES